MKIEDEGFLIFLKKYEENSLFVKILSKNNGIISGYIKNVKKNEIYTYQISNLVYFIWSSKSLDSLGSLKIELKQSNISFIIDNKFNLSLVIIINLLLNNLIYERYIETNFYLNVYSIFDMILSNKKKEYILSEYLIFENSVLNSVGTGFFFRKKTTKTENELFFLSVIEKKDINRKMIFSSFNYINSFLRDYLLKNNLEDIYNTIKTYKKKLLFDF